MFYKCVWVVVVSLFAFVFTWEYYEESEYKS